MQARSVEGSLDRLSPCLSDPVAQPDHSGLRAQHHRHQPDGFAQPDRLNREADPLASIGTTPLTFDERPSLVIVVRGDLAQDVDDAPVTVHESQQHIDRRMTNPRARIVPQQTQHVGSRHRRRKPQQSGAARTPIRAARTWTLGTGSSSAARNVAHRSEPEPTAHPPPTSPPHDDAPQATPSTRHSHPAIGSHRVGLGDTRFEHRPARRARLRISQLDGPVGLKAVGHRGARDHDRVAQAKASPISFHRKKDSVPACDQSARTGHPMIAPVGAEARCPRPPGRWRSRNGLRSPIHHWVFVSSCSAPSHSQDRTRLAGCTVVTALAASLAYMAIASTWPVVVADGDNGDPLGNEIVLVP